MRVCGCTGTTVIINPLTRTHLLLAVNDTVPISVWYKGGVHSTECRLIDTVCVSHNMMCNYERTFSFKQ